MRVCDPLAGDSDRVCVSVRPSQPRGAVRSRVAALWTARLSVALVVRSLWCLGQPLRAWPLLYLRVKFTRGVTSLFLLSAP